MSANGISHLPLKADRQAAKLQLAESKRSTTGTNGYRSLNTFDLGLLPTIYNSDANTNPPIDNDNNGGQLQQGRPWT